MNYLPRQLRPLIAPTDSRLRPDQRALENGDMKLATSEKNRLEEKQRAIKKYIDKKGIVSKPYYFDEWTNPDDTSRIYYRYNGTYFERDRKAKDWSRLPDIFTERLPDDFESFMA